MIEARCDGGLGNGSGEKRLDSEHIVKIKFVGFGVGKVKM